MTHDRFYWKFTRAKSINHSVSAKNYNVVFQTADRSYIEATRQNIRPTHPEIL